VPKAASGSALSDAERELSRDDSRRQSLKKVFALSSAAGDLGEAGRLAERWLEKEPLDPEALTALADVEARRGHRDAAIRLLGSVLDVRPGDTASHKRLARLERWAGHVELSCRHSIAIAEGKSQDIALLADAVRCARNIGMSAVAEALLEAASANDRTGVEQRPESAGRRRRAFERRLTAGSELERWSRPRSVALGYRRTPGLVAGRRHALGDQRARRDQRLT
jgi:tetratricopeptide (TPR) repeat protein